MLRKQVEVAAEILNLKGHYVGKPPGHKFLYLAGDVEGKEIIFASLFLTLIKKKKKMKVTKDMMVNCIY